MCSRTLLCQSSLARVFLPSSCHISSCWGARSTRTVPLLNDGLILARCLKSPQPPPGPYLPRSPESSVAQDGNLRCGFDSTCFTDWRSPTSSVSVAGIRSDNALCVTIWLAWRRLSAFCCHQHVATIVSVTSGIYHCSKMASAECSAWFCAQMHAHCDTY